MTTNKQRNSFLKALIIIINKLAYFTLQDGLLQRKVHF